MAMPACGRRLRSASAVSVALLIAAGNAAPNAQPNRVSVEDLVRGSDLVVLGRVTASDPEAKLVPAGSGRTVVTQHRFKVEVYYKGSGPEELIVATSGGIWTRREGGREEKMLTQAIPSVQVKVGEEMLAFLGPGPGGWAFRATGYLVQKDEATGERHLTLWLRNKRNMRGEALGKFQELEKIHEGPDPTAGVEASLVGSGGLPEVVLVKDLASRLTEIMPGEGVDP